MKRVLAVFLALVLPCVLLGDKALSYEKNVKTNRRGEIYISGIPQVSQKRNFCAPACISMVVRYFDNNLNQKKLAKLFMASKKKGTQSEEIVNAFSNEELAGFDIKRIYAISAEEYTRMMEMYNTASSGKRKRKKSKASATDNIFDSLNPEVARRVFPSVRRELAAIMTTRCIQLIESGIPVLWSVGMNLDPAVKMKGGHMRIIVGYEKSSKQVKRLLYRDPWGGSTKLKKVDLDDAVSMTMELYVITPKNVSILSPQEAEWKRENNSYKKKTFIQQKKCRVPSVRH